MSLPIAERPLIRFFRITLAGILFLSVPSAISACGEVEWT